MNRRSASSCQEAFNLLEKASVAQIQFNASRLTTAPLTVNLLYTMDGGAITGVHSSAEVFTTITVDTHIATRHTIEIVIIDDEIVEEGVFRRVDIVLQEGAGYTVDPDNAISILAVLDNDGPFADVYFSQDAGTVTEGQDIEFIITQDLISDRWNLR